MYIHKLHVGLHAYLVASENVYIHVCIYIIHIYVYIYIFNIFMFVCVVSSVQPMCTRIPSLCMYM